MESNDMHSAKYLLLGSILLFTLISAAGYTEEAGVQLGDNILVDYKIAKDDGSIIEQNSNVEFNVSYQTLIEGFVDGVLGMKIGERKTFTIPPEKGYKSGPLEGLTLTADVDLINVTNYTPTSTTIISSNSTVTNSQSSIISSTIPVGSDTIFLIAMIALISLPLLRKKI